MTLQGLLRLDGRELGPKERSLLPAQAWSQGPVSLVGPTIVGGLAAWARFDGGSRPEQVAERLALRGERALPDLLGDFALAWWNGRRLLLARDQLGIRPLYYLFRDPYFAFASRLKTLLDLAWFEPRPDRRYLRAEFEFRQGYKHHTPFLGIRRLMPGHFLWVESPFRPRRYWWPAPSAAPSTRDWAGEARRLLALAVRDRAAGAGLMLSGGLDSSALAAVLCSLQEQVPAVTAVPVHAGPGRDRTAVGHLLGQYPNLVHRDVDAREYRADGGWMEEAFEQLGYPVHPTYFMDRALARALVEMGANSVMNGFFGDATLSYSGRDSLRRLLAKGAWNQSLKLISKLPWRSVFRPGQPWLQQMSERLLIGFQTLEHWVTMAADLGVEMTFPFLDLRVVEFALSVPPQEFVRGGRPRSLLRRAFADLPPEVVQRNDKVGYVSDYADRIRMPAGRSEIEALRIGRQIVSGRFLSWLETGGPRDE